MRISHVLRLLALMLAAMMILAACGGTEEADDTEATDEATDGASETPDGSTEEDPVEGTETESTGQAAGGATAEAVIAADELVCGVNGQLNGFSLEGSDGYTGIDVDYCRGIAAAILGDPEKVRYENLTADTRFQALLDGQVDVLIRNGTWTASRDGDLGLQWTAPTYYDGQGMLVNDADPAQSVADMDGYVVCVQTGTTTELNLETFFANEGISYEPVNVVDEAAVTENFSTGACDAYTTDRSGLASFAATYTGGDVRILPDVMSKEPLGPAVREGDDQWYDIVQWVVFATFQAEEFGLTSENIEGFDAGENADIARFLGQEADQTTGVGLGFPDEEWAVRVITAIGNYQEIFDRNIVPIGLDAGVNQIWNECEAERCGLHYPPPYR